MIFLAFSFFVLGLFSERIRKKDIIEV